MSCDCNYRWYNNCANNKTEPDPLTERADVGQPVIIVTRIADKQPAIDDSILVILAQRSYKIGHS